MAKFLAIIKIKHVFYAFTAALQTLGFNTFLGAKQKSIHRKSFLAPTVFKERGGIQKLRHCLISLLLLKIFT